MSKKRTILLGTFILTAAGFTSRIIGFFYRIFLSRTFGEEGMGLYQLIFPVFALCFSFTTAGIETALSRNVARNISLQKETDAKETVYAGLFLSVLLSFLSLLFLRRYAKAIAIASLLEPRCEPLLQVMAYALPFASIHSCICGYYLGRKKTGITALAQLVEQLTRVSFAILFSRYLIGAGQIPSVEVAVMGLVIGDICSSLFCILVSRKELQLPPLSCTKRILAYGRHMKELLPVSLPLTANRVLLNLLQSMEAVSIPQSLQLYGETTAEALGAYGVLTGMALPLLLFPTAITNSAALMLLPTIAEVQVSEGHTRLAALVRKVAFSCFFLGFFCLLVFLLFGRWMGHFLFQSEAAGDFLVTLAWMCPFLYTNTTLVSMINGLGKTSVSFCIHTAGLLLRIGSVRFLIPSFGMLGYLWGVFASQLLVSVLAICYLHRFLSKQKG